MKEIVISQGPSCPDPRKGPWRHTPHGTLRASPTPREPPVHRSTSPRLSMTAAEPGIRQPVLVQQQPDPSARHLALARGRLGNDRERNGLSGQKPRGNY